MYPRYTRDLTGAGAWRGSLPPLSPLLRASTLSPRQAYIPTMVDKIKKIRGWIVDRGLDIDIEVDGGVKADWTIAQCADAGANCFIAGSGMFKYDDLSVGCKELREIATAAQKGQIMPEGADISWLMAKA